MNLLSDYVGPYCDIECMDDQGYFVDNDDGDIVNSSVVPRFRCLEQIDSDNYKAWFGYENHNPNNVYIKLKGENSIYMNKTRVSIDTNPPTKFESGIVKYAMAIG